MKNIESCDCDVRISGGNLNKGSVTIPANSTYTLILDYPFDGTEHKFEIKSGKNSLGTNDLIGKICDIYENKIYKDEKSIDKYKVFGHGIEDLALVGITVNHGKKIIRIDVDS